MSYAQHPLIRPATIEARLYQQIILDTAARANTLVVLPTGLGKTPIAIMLAAHRLSEFPDSKILVMAPTRPLALQHCKTFGRTMALPPQEFFLLTGHVPPDEREKVWRDARMIFATPQVVEHDLITKKLSLADFSLLVFDEAHRAVGNYSYKFIAERYMRDAKAPLILALTASPGAEPGKIDEVRRNLFIERVEIRSDRDADVKPYTQPIEIKWKRLELPETFSQVKRLLEEQLREHLGALKKLGFITSVQNVRKRDLLRVQEGLAEKMHEFEPKPPEEFYTALIAQATAFRLCHAVEMLETQGFEPMSQYLSRLVRKAGMPGAPRAVKLLMNDQRMKQIISITERVSGRVEHPKLAETLRLVQEQLARNPNSRIIVFAHYRDSAEQLTKELGQVDGVKAVKFIGQARRGSEEGLSQREQAKILEKFRAGGINVLVSTSVGEEGLDIPSVDLVVFYEAVPSEIRTIQRRGRTGRARPGRVVVLLAKDTRDEAFYWSAVHKERRMRETLRGYAEGGKSLVKGQKAMEEFAAEKVKVFADHREIASGVVGELTKLGVEVEARQLDVGDFILSDRVGVERKSVNDFLQSIVDKRLMEQAARLRETFERPILILEGEGLYSLRAIHPNAIRGALAALAVDFGVSILPTRDEKETAAILAIIAKREQIDQARAVAIRGEAKGLTLSELQRFIVEGLPGVSAVLAKRLLEHFGTVERVMSASEKELQEVHGIGVEKAKEIRRVLSAGYETEDRHT